MDKQSLSPEEVLRVAFGNIIGKVEHPVLAAIFCVNQGRVSEAITAIRYTMEHHKLIYRITQGKAKIVEINGEGEGEKKIPPRLEAPTLLLTTNERH